MKGLCSYASGLLFCAVACLLMSQAHAADVIAWGQPDEVSRRLGITDYRMGCSADAATCLARMEKRFSKSEARVSISFGMHEAPEAALTRAASYGRFASQNSYVSEISVDDFVSFLRALPKDVQPSFVEQLINAAKPAQTPARFAITVYEDQLEYLHRSPLLTSAARAKTDRVVVYLHYREGVEQYAATIERVRALFPNALVYGGVYHYTRVGRLPCRRGETAACSPEAEIALFTRSLVVQESLLKSGKLDGLELFPGQLAHVSDWSVWKNTNACARPPGNDESCIQATETMINHLKATLTRLPSSPSGISRQR